MPGFPVMTQVNKKYSYLTHLLDSELAWADLDFIPEHLKSVMRVPDELIKRTHSYLTHR